MNDVALLSSTDKILLLLYALQKFKGLTTATLTLTMMQLLLKASNHTALLLPNRSASNRQQQLCREVCETAFADIPQFCNLPLQVAYRTLSDPKYCGKMEVIIGIFFKKGGKCDYHYMPNLYFPRYSDKIISFCGIIMAGVN